MIIKKVGFIGLGSMGLGMAKSLILKEFSLYGYDLNPNAIDAIQENGAIKVGNSALEDAQEFDALLLTLVNAKQVESVLFESGLYEKLKKTTPIIIHSTMSANSAKSIGQRLAEAGLTMIDAPISGGSVKAANGELTIMASGTKDSMALVEPLFSAMAERIYHIGEEIGQGSTVKTIHQLLAGVHIAVAAESMAMAAKAGISLDMMYDVVTHAAGNSWMFENRMTKVLSGDYTPNSMVDIFVKDLGLVLDTGHALNFPLPLASIAHQMFLAASSEGFGQLDDSAVIKIFKGIELPSTNQ